MTDQQRIAEAEGKIAMVLGDLEIVIGGRVSHLMVLSEDISTIADPRRELRRVRIEVEVPRQSTWAV
jgi:hypothetical protein